MSTFSVNSLNELTNEASTRFTCDGNGNLTKRTPSSGFAATNYYDAENRLVDVETSSNAHLVQIPIRTTFVYDGLSRLRQQLQWTNSTGSGGGSSPPPTGGGSNSWTLVGGTAYIYDGNRVIQERDYYNNPLVSYTRGNDLSGTMDGAGGIGGLLARSDGYSSGSFTNHVFYHADGNGNITYLVNSSQTLAASYRYDPFGNLLASSGSLAASNTYRFSSKEFITSVGLYYYLYRFYDPDLQRWLNRDPIQEFGGINLYELARNNPTYYADSAGQQLVVLAVPPVLEPVLDPILEPIAQPITQPIIQPIGQPIIEPLPIIHPNPPTTSPICGIPDPKNPPIWIPPPHVNSPLEKEKRDEDECAKIAKKWAENYKKKHGKSPPVKDYLDQVQKCMEKKGYKIGKEA